MFRYYGWNVVAAAVLFQAITGGIFLYSFTLWIKPWSVEFGAAPSYIILAFTLGTLSYTLVAPFLGRALDRLSIRALVCWGAVLVGLGFALISIATSMAQIIALYATVIGVGGQMAGTLSGQTLAAKWFRARRGLALGISGLGGSLGGLLAPPLVALLLEAVGWRQAHLILAAVIIGVVVPVSWLVVSNSPEAKGVEPEPENPRAAPSAALDDRGWTVPAILTSRTFVVCAMAFPPLAACAAAVQQNLGPFAAELGIQPVRLSLVLSTIAVGAILGKLAFGALVDRIDHRLVYWMAAAVCVTGLMAMLGGPDYKRLLAAAGLLGFGSGSVIPVLGAIVGARFGPRSFGQVMGLMGMATLLSTFGALILASVREASGSYDLALLAFAALLAPTSAVMAFLPAVARRDRPAGPKPAVADASF